MASEVSSHVILSAAKNLSSVLPIGLRMEERFFAALRMTCLDVLGIHI